MTDRGPPSLFLPLSFFPPVRSPGQGKKELCHAFHLQQAILLCCLASFHILRYLFKHLGLFGGRDR